MTAEEWGVEVFGGAASLTANSHRYANEIEIEGDELRISLEGPSGHALTYVKMPKLQEFFTANGYELKKVKP